MARGRPGPLRNFTGLLASLAIPLALACGTATPPPLRTPTVSDVQSHGLAKGEHLLFRPRGNPEALLGRAIHATEEGEIVIADELAAGCRVRAKPTPEAWTRRYVTTLESMSDVGAEFDAIANLKLAYGSHGRVQVTIKNVERLDADLDGHCGDWVVTSVWAGTGARHISASSEAHAGGGVHKFGVDVGGDQRSKQTEATSFEWSNPQAWMFAARRGDSRPARIELSAEMPPVLQNGQTYRIRVHPNRSVWLIVYYREESGEVGKLLPNKENPQVAVAAGERRALPQLQVGLRDPAVGVREWIGICAFDDLEYVKQFAPPRGAASPEQMKQWHDELPERLHAIGGRHYHCEEIGYRIEPREQDP